MTVLLVGIGLTMITSAVVMAWLQRAYHSPELVAHRFREPQANRASEGEKYWLFQLNSLISVLMVFGAAIYGFDWLFTDQAVGWGVGSVQAVSVILVYDLLYYAMHRWLFHQKKLMRFVHGLHHQARTPTARESLFTHPAELIAGLGLLLFSTWLVGPVHVVAFSVAFFVYSVMNVVIHSGVAFPSGPMRLFNLWARKHHGHHGVNMNKNFGSLTPVWDVLFRTAI